MTILRQNKRITRSFYVGRGKGKSRGSVNLSHQIPPHRRHRDDDAGEQPDSGLLIALGDVEVDDVRKFEKRFREAARDRLGDLLERVSRGAELTEEDQDAIESLANDVKSASG